MNRPERQFSSEQIMHVLERAGFRQARRAKGSHQAYCKSVAMVACSP